MTVPQVVRGGVIRTWLALGGLAGVFAGACTSGGMSSAGEQTPELERPEQQPTCREPPESPALLQFPGERCPWVLSLGEDADTVRLSSLELDPPKALSGTLPQACTMATCRFAGVDTPAGPLLLVTRPSPEGEIPSAAFVAAPAGPEILDFIDLWAGAGAPVRADFTVVGPAHSLEPVVCGRTLGMVVTSRLPAGDAVDPPEPLQARAGLYRAEQGELVPADKPAEDCRSVPFQLP